MKEDVLTRNEIYAAMESGEPYASYIKTILGQVAVTVWDNVLEKPVDVILRGNPKKKEPDSIVKVWSLKEDTFFKRVNRNQFNKDLIIPFTAKEVVIEEKRVGQSTDEELMELLDLKKLKWLGFLNKINGIDSVPVLFRLKMLAEESEKSKKVIDQLEKRISEVQAKDYTPTPAEEVEEEE